MAAPSKSWVTISDGQVDADSPLDTTLMTGIRDDLVHLEEWLGMSYTAAQDHDHDGANSKAVASVADNAITTAKIQDGAVTGAKINKTPASSSSQSISTLSSWTPAAGLYQVVEDGTNQWITFNLYISSTWRGFSGTGAYKEAVGLHICDGTNMRFYNGDSGASQTLYYQTF